MVSIKPNTRRQLLNFTHSVECLTILKGLQRVGSSDILATVDDVFLHDCTDSLCCHTPLRTQQVIQSVDEFPYLTKEFIEHNYLELMPRHCFGTSCSNAARYHAVVKRNSQFELSITARMQKPGRYKQSQIGFLDPRRIYVLDCSHLPEIGNCLLPCHGWQR